MNSFNSVVRLSLIEYLNFFYDFFLIQSSKNEDLKKLKYEH